MPVIEIDLPSNLLRDISDLAEYNDIDRESFIALALAEKIGELKGAIFNKAIQDEVGAVKPLIQRYPTIKAMIAHENFIVHFEFEDGLNGTFDMKPLIHRLGFFKSLSEPGVSDTLKLSSDGKSIQWTNPVTRQETSIRTAILLDEIGPRERVSTKELNCSFTPDS